MFILVLALLYTPIGTTDGKKCSETRCCAGYWFDSSGNCVVCPSGLYGIHCSTPCANGFYGELCADRCECPVELCNASIGCVRKQDVSPQNVSSLSIAIPITIGVLGFIVLIITCLLFKTKHLSKRRVSHRTSEHNYYDDVCNISKANTNNSCVDLKPMISLPPPLQPRNY